MAQNLPTGPATDKGIELFTWTTPNGWKASILLEELKEAYNLSYTTTSIDIGTNVQKEPWFTSINPNGRIPAIIDHDNNDLPVFEGNAILSYLTRKYDPDHLFSFSPDSDDYTRAESWIGWQHGGVGPMQGQAGHFLRAAKEQIPWAIQRYVGETERLYGILDAHLAKPENKGYVVGGRYSIADIALVGWVNVAPFATLDLEGQFPHVAAWLRKIWERPAVQKGFAVPKPSAFGGSTLSDETKKQIEELKKVVDESKKKYGYVYTSP